jgi:hypothetical protein
MLDHLLLDYVDVCGCRAGCWGSVGHLLLSGIVDLGGITDLGGGMLRSFLVLGVVLDLRSCFVQDHRRRSHGRVWRPCNLPVLAALRAVDRRWGRRHHREPITVPVRMPVLMPPYSRHPYPRYVKGHVE